MTTHTRPTPAEALQSFYTTLQAMQGVIDLAQHAADHDDEASHFAHLLETFIQSLAPVYCVLADAHRDEQEGGAA
jgi:hypothetical protein